MDDSYRVSQAPAELARPDIRLHGAVDDGMLAVFLDALAAAEEGSGPLVLELTTSGGDADTGRRMATDIRLFRERTGRRTLFLGKAIVYSAGVTVMSAFPREDRWLSEGAALLIHCRKLDHDMRFEGPLKGERTRVEALLAEIDVGIRMEEEGFRQLIAGGQVGLRELLDRAEAGWYLDANDALDRGLIGGVI